VSTTTHDLPHGLDLVVAFVNTLDVEQGIDELEGDGLRAWLDRSGLSEPGLTIGSREREQALELREALRDLMVAHNDGRDNARAGQALERVSRAGELGVQFTPDGTPKLATRAQGFDAALAQLLVPVVEASADGTWRRVKACRAADCHWAFYDRSRNRSGVWCEMAVCGNRTKVRTYRRRAPAGPSAA
jgi:predicted RNA-binding Zn ribbon-like protein